MTTIYAVTEHDHKMRSYWYDTKRRAEEHKRKDKQGTETESGEMDNVSFPISKAGIVEALNYVIGLTCMNEG